MNNEITFTGRVSVVLPVESGTSASGKSWSKQTIVITEEDVQYPISGRTERATTHTAARRRARRPAFLMNNP